MFSRHNQGIFHQEEALEFDSAPFLPQPRPTGAPRLHSLPRGLGPGKGRGTAVSNEQQLHGLKVRSSSWFPAALPCLLQDCRLLAAVNSSPIQNLL